MVPMTFLVLLSVWVFLQADLTGPGESSAIAGMQYGIQGQQAPELNLTTWINGNGLSINPIELNNLKGKVIYLYFFQDW
jgi:hypothetical protein